MQPLPRSVLTLWRLVAAAVAVAATALLVAGDVALRQVTDPGFPPVVVPVAVGLLVGAGGVAIAAARHRRWGFELTDEWVAAQWGVIVHHTATVPRNRVQTVTTGNGPVDRLLGLTTVVVHTAGSAAPNLHLPHLDDATVAWLREELGRGVAA